MDDSFVDDNDLKVEFETSERVRRAAEARKRALQRAQALAGAATQPVSASESERGSVSGDAAGSGGDEGGGSENDDDAFCVLWQPGAVEPGVGDIETETSATTSVVVVAAVVTSSESNITVSGLMLESGLEVTERVRALDWTAILEMEDDIEHV